MACVWVLFNIHIQHDSTIRTCRLYPEQSTRFSLSHCIFCAVCASVTVSSTIFYSITHTIHIQTLSKGRHYLWHKQEKNKETNFMWVLLFLYFTTEWSSVPSLDTEHLLTLTDTEQKKVEMSKLGVLEPELKTNLQLAISVMDTMPHKMKTNAELLVEGNQTLFKIRAGDPYLRCVVFQGHDDIKLHWTIKFNRDLCHDDLHEAFFHGHECPHDTPCRRQAMKVIYPYRNPSEISIVCKELRITFSDPNPVKTIVVPLSM